MPTATERAQEALTPGTFLHDAAARQFRDKAQLGDGCWGWTGNRMTVGYGAVRLGKRGDRTMVYAHRLSYVIHYGPIDAGKLVLHSCDNRLCVNPTHLRLGSISENMEDKFRRGRCSGRLTAAQRDDLARKVVSGEMTRKEAAKSVGLDASSVDKLVRQRQTRGLL